MWPELTEALVQQRNICKGSLGGGRGSSRVPSHGPAAPWHPPEPCQNNSVQPGASRIKIEGEGGMQNILPSQPMKKLPVCIHTRVFLCFFSLHLYLLMFCMLAISGELQAPMVPGYGSSNLGEYKVLAQYGLPQMQPRLADFLQNHNLDMLEGFNRRDPPWEALQGEDFISEPSN